MEEGLLCISAFEPLEWSEHGKWFWAYIMWFYYISLTRLLFSGKLRVTISTLKYITENNRVWNKNKKDLQNVRNNILEKYAPFYWVIICMITKSPHHFIFFFHAYLFLFVQPWIIKHTHRLSGIQIPADHQSCSCSAPCKLWALWEEVFPV